MGLIEVCTKNINRNNNRQYTLKEDELIDKVNFYVITDNRNFSSKGLYDTDNKNNKERVR